MNFSTLSSPYLTHVSPTNFSPRQPPPIWIAPRPTHVAQVPESPATCPAVALSPTLFPGPGGGVRGSRPGRLRPEEAAHSSRAAVHPVHSPAAQAGAPLTSWVWRAAAARRGRGDAAGFWPGWDMVRPQQALPPGGSSGDWKGGLGGERREGGSRGADGRAVRQLFRPSPEPVWGLRLAHWALPFLPAAGCSGSGLKLNTLGPASSPSDPLRPTHRILWFSVVRRGGVGGLGVPPPTYLVVQQRESGTLAWPIYASTLLPKNGGK